MKKMTDRNFYFDVYDLSMMVLFAFASALLNTYLPIKTFTEYLGIPGPAAGMALLGGFIFVFWVALARAIIRKKYVAIVTSLLIASFCLLIAPWYGIVSPIWFGIYGIIALLFIGLFVELTWSGSKFRVGLGGGIGNLACLGITWIACGVHISVWASPELAPILLIAAFISGFIGALAGYWISKIFCT